MTLDTATVREGFALESTEGNGAEYTKGNRGRSGVPQGASGRHEGKTGGRRSSARGMKGQWRRRIWNIHQTANSARKKKGKSRWDLDV